jgi:hypothetical protein
MINCDRFVTQFKGQEMKTVLIHYLELLFIERDNPDRRQEAI